MSLLIERMRRLESSESRIIPSMLSYSSSETYAPITSIERTYATKGGRTTGAGRGVRRRS
jgi:hypothetical protein